MASDVVTLVDSNVLLDIVTDDPTWSAWSSNALAEAFDHGRVVVNPIVYAEVSVSFDLIENLDDALPATQFLREPLPYAAGFLAGKAFLAYRRRGGSRPTPPSRLLHRCTRRCLRLSTANSRRPALPDLLRRPRRSRPRVSGLSWGG